MYLRLHLKITEKSTFNLCKNIFDMLFFFLITDNLDMNTKYLQLTTLDVKSFLVSSTVLIIPHRERFASPGLHLSMLLFVGENGKRLKVSMDSNLKSR